jgi:16S rRNA (cytosine1402-N4)-methyltransferase
MGYEEHIPVMAEEVTKFILTDRDGCYIDATLGTGGHALHLFRSAGGSLSVTGLDRDIRALEEAKRRLARYAGRVAFLQGNFRRIGTLAADPPYDGILADLGLSSLQLSDSSRGFSYLTDGPLDMSMGGEGRSVQKLIMEGSEREIDLVLRDYGEERRHRAVAREIVRERTSCPITGTHQLKRIVERALPVKGRMSSLSRVFQAFRIWSNEELESLEEFLPQSLELLKPGGRLVVISYHSLEDRIVKRFLKQEEAGCVCPKEFPECRCGKTERVKIVTRRPVRPSQQEITENPRARSARLRAAERI